MVPHSCEKLLPRRFRGRQMQTSHFKINLCWVVVEDRWLHPYLYKTPAKATEATRINAVTFLRFYNHRKTRLQAAPDQDQPRGKGGHFLKSERSRPTSVPVTRFFLDTRRQHEATVVECSLFFCLSGDGWTLTNQWLIHRSTFQFTSFC